MTDRFTILVPTYNQARYLPAALDSLLAQTCRDWHAVIVNDGSTDDTRSVLDAYAKHDNRLLVVHQANGGVASALNTGLQHARGEWVCWLSSDDWYLPNRLERTDDFLRSHPDARFVHSAWRYYDQQMARITPSWMSKERIPPSWLQTLTFFSFNFVNGITITIHRSLFDRFGGFNTNLRDAQDFEMWVRMSRTVPFHYIDEPLCVQRVHNDMGSRTNPSAGYYEAAAVLMACLNEFPFEQLLLLAHPANSTLIDEVLALVLGTAVDTSSAMYLGVGYHGALLQRLGQWIASFGPRQKNDFISKLEELASACLSLPSLSPLADPFRSAATLVRSGAAWEPMDISGHFKARLDLLRTHPGQEAEAGQLERFLGRIDLPCLIGQTALHLRNHDAPHVPFRAESAWRPSHWPTLEELLFWRRVTPSLHRAPWDLPDRPLLIWGAGRAGRAAATRYEFLRAEGFVDSDPAKRNTELDGLPVQHADDLKAEIKAGRRPYILIASIFHEEISHVLGKLGLLPGTDFVVVP